jgi:NAD-dependent SIR2 family protein deacetylase
MLARRPLSEFRVSSELSLPSFCSGDLGSDPQDVEAAEDRDDMLESHRGQKETALTGLGGEQSIASLRRQSQDSTPWQEGSSDCSSPPKFAQPRRICSAPSGLSIMGADDHRASPHANGSSQRGWVSRLISMANSPTTQYTPPSVEHSPLSNFSGFSFGSNSSGGLSTTDRCRNRIRELSDLLRSPEVTKVIVLLGAGASQEAHLETYVNLEKHFFSLAEGKLTEHDTKPYGVPSFTYSQLFGPPHWWQNPDEIVNGVSWERFMAYKRVSDAFCASMVEKFAEAEPHQGYLDLQEVLAAWKNGELTPLTPQESEEEQTRGEVKQPTPKTKEIIVATTNLDQLSVKTFQGVATVHEMHGSIDYVRQHAIPLKQGKTSNAQCGVSDAARPGATEGLLQKPLVMHFEEPYYREVRCRRASAAGSDTEQGETESFTFRSMKPELNKFVHGCAAGTVVLEIGCSQRVKAVPMLRESMVERGATVFVVNPTEKSTRAKNRLLAAQPMLMPKLGNLKVIPSGFIDFADALRWELLGTEP